MSRFVTKFCVAGLVAATSIAVASSAGATGSLSVSAVSTSAKTVISAKALTVNVTVPSGTAQLTATLSNGSVDPILATTVKSVSASGTTKAHADRSWQDPCGSARRSGTTCCHSLLSTASADDLDQVQ